MAKEIFYKCNCTGQTFTSDEWHDWVTTHDTNEVVFEYKGFKFTIHDVCVNAERPLEYRKDKSYFKVYCAELPNGGFAGGVDYWFVNGGGGCFPSYNNKRDIFSSKNELVFHYLKFFESECKTKLRDLKNCTEVDDDGNIKDSTPNMRLLEHFLKKIDDYKDYYDPRQLSLF